MRDLFLPLLTSLLHDTAGSFWASLVSKPSPIALAKGVKNQAELEGMRAAHVRDGVAMVLALSRLERDVAAGQTISEVDVDTRTTASRAQQDKFIGEHYARGKLRSKRASNLSTDPLADRTTARAEGRPFSPVFRRSPCCNYARCALVAFCIQVGGGAWNWIGTFAQNNLLRSAQAVSLISLAGWNVMFDICCYVQPHLMLQSTCSRAR